MPEKADDASPGARSTLADWRQGDYTLSVKEFLTAEDWNGENLEVDATPVIGLCVVTQTCDIVNDAPGREYVVVCPLVDISDEVYKVVANGSSPFAALIERPPGPRTVVDLNRMMSLRKSLLERLDRIDGFITDDGLTQFAGALERKHGRFAFPNDFAAVLTRLRKTVRDASRKQNSDNGKAYRSIQTVRAAAYPSWDAENVTVCFYCVLEPESSREATLDKIAETMVLHLSKIQWPAGFGPSNPSFRLVTLDKMTAVEWIESHSVDWDFISVDGGAATD
jgi:hypothetical protein